MVIALGLFFSELGLIQEVRQFFRKILPKFWSCLTNKCVIPPLFDKNKMGEWGESWNLPFLRNLRKGVASIDSALGHDSEKGPHWAEAREFPVSREQTEQGENSRHQPWRPFLLEQCSLNLKFLSLSQPPKCLVSL